MTRTERNSHLLSFLEQVRPLIGRYARDFHLDFDDLYQDATLQLITLLESGKLDFGRNPGAVVAHFVEYRIIDRLRYLKRRPSISLDAALTADNNGQDDGVTTLADLIPSPYNHEPLELLLCWERLQELAPVVASMPGSHGQAVRRWFDHAASLFNPEVVA
jgi:DNA-directed RNA polymerase specialized sigma24 family protein